MSLQKTSARSRDTKKRKTATASGWLRWWPLLLAIAVTLMAVKTAEILPLMGAGGLTKLRLLYPFVMLLREHALGLSESARESLAGTMLYAQFPLYGLYASIVMKRKSWRAALAQIAVIHLLAFGALWILSKH